MKKTLDVSLSHTKPRVLEFLACSLINSKEVGCLPITLDINKDDHQVWNEHFASIDIADTGGTQRVVLLKGSKNSIQMVVFADSVSEQGDAIDFMLREPPITGASLSQIQEVRNIITSRSRKENHFRVKADTYIEVTKANCSVVMT